MFRLYYRTGGTRNFMWNATLTIDSDPVEVTRSGTDVRRAGYPTITLPISAPIPTQFAPVGMRTYDDSVSRAA